MRTNLLSCFRAWAVILALGFAMAPLAEATGPTSRTEPTPVARRETLWGLPRDDPAIAVGAIIGGIALLVVFVWVAVRVGDKS